MFKTISDKKIIEGIKNQDGKTLEWLYDNYYQTVKKYIINNRGTDEDVSDIFQDAVIIVYNQIIEEKLHLTTDLKGYFYGVARNIWNAQLRKKKRTTELESDFPDDFDIDESTDLIFERILSRTFRKLKPDCRELLTLYYKGLSYSEIAEKQGLKNDIYARRKKYLCKEILIELVKKDREYQEYLNR